jgi:hypothetical protein
MLYDGSWRRSKSKLVKKLRGHGHEAVAAAPNTGVNTITGEGLAEVLQGVSVVVDVSNSPSWDDAEVLKFFETSTRNLLTGEAAADVGHHVALSVVGTDWLSESGYMRGKIAQEQLIKESSIPYSIVSFNGRCLGTRCLFRMVSASVHWMVAPWNSPQSQSWIRTRLPSRIEDCIGRPLFRYIRSQLTPNSSIRSRFRLRGLLLSKSCVVLNDVVEIVHRLPSMTQRSTELHISAPVMPTNNNYTDKL